MRLQPHSGDDAPMRRLGDVHESRPHGRWTCEGRGGAYRRSGEWIRGTHQLENLGMSRPLYSAPVMVLILGPCVLAQVFTLTSLAFLTIFINALLSLYRSRHHPEMSTPPLRHQPSYTLAPPTPFPPQYLPASSWGSVWSGREDEEVQTPSRRRRLDSGEAAKIK